MRRIHVARARARDEDGAILVTVVIISFVLAGLFLLVADTGERADKVSARESNWNRSLAVAEAGIDHGIQIIQAAVIGVANPFPPCPQVIHPARVGTVIPSVEDDPEARERFDVYICWTPGRYVIDSRGTVGVTAGLTQSRRVQVELLPEGAPLAADPPAEPSPPESPTFASSVFSLTTYEVQGSITVEGDIWAKDNVDLDSRTIIHGSVTSERGAISITGPPPPGHEYSVVGKVWSGGSRVTGATAGWAIKLDRAPVLGNLKASVYNPTNPTECGTDQTQSFYEVILGNQQTKVIGKITTWGKKSGAGAHEGGTLEERTCTQAAPSRPTVGFTFNPANYDPATYRSFSSVAAFTSHLNAASRQLSGTYYVWEPPGTVNRMLDLDRATVVGDTTIVTNAPIFTNQLRDTTSEKMLVLVSSYDPQSDASSAPACDYDRTGSKCAAYLMNNFNLNPDTGSCATAVLVYAENGPVAVKNTSQGGGPDFCGALYGDPVLMKNNQWIRFDERVQNVAGFVSEGPEGSSNTDPVPPSPDPSDPEGVGSGEGGRFTVRSWRELSA